MKVFTLFWLNGKSELVKGTDPADAFTRGGYGNGALSALDFYGNGDIRNQYQWNKEKRTWEKI